jgi:hypothetical protein
LEGEEVQLLLILNLVTVHTYFCILASHVVARRGDRISGALYRMLVEIHEKQGQLGKSSMYVKKSKAKQSRYTPWWSLEGEKI